MQDRPESQFPVKNIMKEVAAPTEVAWARMKRFVRFLLMVPNVV